MKEEKNLMVIVGPTAVGKTSTAIDVAIRLNGEIVSADSMQIYKYMDIGTAKPTRDEMKGIKHHMIDIIEPDQEFSVADYKKMAEEKIDEILHTGKLPILTGGTGLYIKSITDNYFFSEADVDWPLRNKLKDQFVKYGKMYMYEKLKQIDPKTAEKVHPNDTKRIIRALEVYEKTGKPISYYYEQTKLRKPKYKLIIYGLEAPRKKLYEKINKRVDKMIEKGLVQEVKNLLDMGFTKKMNSMKGLGYKQIIDYLEGKLTLDEAINLIKRETRRFAKRQFTWFKKDKRIIWINTDELNPVDFIYENYLKFAGK
ncbi:MAG: tRNA dimethylallyltransferase [Thermosediminibacterales bacterium]|nr:tRNA dimethylallyltransferase [Thermosediminibacterales bacterium]MDK2836177.1 tRNA dimethylallyltransferase [Thermosediminibacterales bacterium]